MAKDIFTNEELNYIDAKSWELCARLFFNPHKKDTIDDVLKEVFEKGKKSVNND